MALAIKAKRKLLGISQEELSGLADIDRTYASQLERAIANPSLSVICRVAEALDLTLVEMIQGKLRPTQEHTHVTKN